MQRTSYPLLFFLVLLIRPHTANADFFPLQLTPESYNVDIIVEKTATAPLVPATTASLDNGFANTGYSFYEKGYNLNAPTTGLPSPGVRFTSELLADYDFQLAPNYKTNNVFLVDSVITNVTVAISNPVACTRLSFLMTAGNGPATIQYVVHYQDSGTQTATLTCPDWFNGISGACVAHGRADVTTFAFDGVNSSSPSLFQRDVVLTTTNSPVTSIDVRWTTGANHIAVFAISASANVEDPFVPLALSGFNADVIIESTAARPGFMQSATTASVERGTINAGWTIFETGYYPPSASTGLPSAGTMLTNLISSDHRYALASTYTNNNAVLLDPSSPAANVSLINPYTGTGLSFLCTAASGPAVLKAVAQHADGSAETNVFNIPDWLAGANPAATSIGRVNLNSRLVDSSAMVKFFAADIALTNSSSPITNVALNFVSGDSATHAYILAVSGAFSNNIATPALLSISRSSPTTIAIISSGPGELQSASIPGGSNANWRVEGPISTSTNLSFDGPARFYRVRGM